MNAVPDITAISAALASLKAAKDITQAMIGPRDAAAFQEKRLELQNAVLDAQSSVFAANEERTALIEKVRQLEKELARLEAWEADKQRYEMRSLSRHGAAIVYSLKSDAVDSEPFHCICATCYEQGKKVPLQFSRVAFMGGEEQILACPVCKTEVHTDRWPPTA